MPVRYSSGNKFLKRLSKFSGVKRTKPRRKPKKKKGKKKKTVPVFLKRLRPRPRRRPKGRRGRK